MQNTEPSFAEATKGRHGMQNNERKQNHRPTAVWVFGVLNIAVGIYGLIRFYPGIYKMIEYLVKVRVNPEQISGPGTLFLFLIAVSLGLGFWLIVLGIGLLTTKKWARRGSIIFARIMIVFMVITLGYIALIIFLAWPHWYFALNLNIYNALAVITWIYYIALLKYMQKPKVKEAFRGIGE